MNTFTEYEQRQIIDMYKNNVSIDDIIRKFNAIERDIRVVLKSNSVDRQYNSFTEELSNRIVSLYLDKYTQKEKGNIKNI